MLINYFKKLYYLIKMIENHEIILNNTNICESGVVIIDLNSIISNYNYYKNKIYPSKVIPVVKSNAYNMNDIKIIETLYNIGVNEYYVATINEGINIKKKINVTIYVLCGLYLKTEKIFYDNNLIPVINSFEQLYRWNDFAKNINTKLDCIIHYDTGMSRTGLQYTEIIDFEKNINIFNNINILYIITHLISSNDDNKNMEQYNKFKNLPKAIIDKYNSKLSISNSSSYFLSNIFDKDAIRIGIGLYGFFDDLDNSLYVYTRIIQIKNLKEGETIGYDSKYTVQKNGIFATINMGYADGLINNLKENYVYIKNYRSKIVGKISMDFTVIDVTEIPKKYIYEGSWVEIFGNNSKISNIIKENKNLSYYEIIIHLGSRFKKIFIDVK